jgi:hypothetical protein
MKIIPLAAVPSQTFSAVLGGQNCQLAIYQKSTGLFIDVRMNGAGVALAVLALDRNRTVRLDDGTFIGDLVFYDTQGVDDPDYTGLGARFKLAYIEPSDDLY